MWAAAKAEQHMTPHCLSSYFLSASYIDMDEEQGKREITREMEDFKKPNLISLSSLN